MNRAILADSSPSVKLIFSALVVVGTWLIFQLLAIVSGMLFFIVEFEEVIEMMDRMHDPESVKYLKYVQAVTSIGLFIVSSFIIALALDREIFNFLLLNRVPGKRSLLLVGIFIVTILPFSNLLTELNRSLSLPDSLSPVQSFFEEKESQMEGIMRSFLNVKGMWALLANLLIIAVIPAFGEELLFRGIFQRLFTLLTKNSHAGIIIAALAFSALHMQFLSFLPRFVLGILFGYFVFWSGSLWPAILAHFINNSLAVIYYYFLARSTRLITRQDYSGMTEIDLENVGAPGHAQYLGVLSIFITVLLVYLIYRSMRAKDCFNRY